MNEIKGALLFPGQGSQEVGMGRDLAEADAEIMDLWKRAEKISRLPLRELYWDGGENLDDTRLLQPALTVANFGLWAALSRRFKPAATAGHSLGEYSALAAAGVLDFDKVMDLVTLRGELMSAADPSGQGGMAAIVKLDRATAQALVDEINKEIAEAPERSLRIVNFNTPAQFVASGTAAAIKRLTEKARDYKGRAIALAVSGAFHSPFMAEAAKELNSALAKCSFNKPRFPVYCNVSGQAEPGADGVKAALMAQMTSPVRWIETVSALFADGIRSFVECGPKNVLGKMVGPILADQAGEGEYAVLSLNNAEDVRGADL